MKGRAGHGSFEIPLSVPHMAGNERRYLEECLTTNYVSSVGPFVERFEAEFAAYVGARFAVACVNGTAALHLGMRLLGVEPGDEVFVASFTFVASVNAILYERATPVLIDSEPHTWNLDPILVVTEIERRARLGLKQPKAVEFVHILGHPGEIQPVAEVCARHGIALLEDAAEALGSRYVTGSYAGTHVGRIGRLGCFSFNGNKVITTGGGGMIATDDERLASRARHLVRQARVPGPEYIHDEVGYNYRMTNLAAALGVAQLEQLPAFLAAKARIAAAYDTALSGVRGLTRPPRASWAAPSHWLYSVLIEPASFGRDREAVRRHLQAKGIEARPLWCPAHLMEPYRHLPYLGGGVSQETFAKGLSLPSSVSLAASEGERVVAALLESPAEG